MTTRQLRLNLSAKRGSLSDPSQLARPHPKSAGEAGAAAPKKSGRDVVWGARCRRGHVFQAEHFAGMSRNRAIAGANVSLLSD
jgi:hypothetical protein